MKRGGRPQYARTLAAVDPDDETPQRNELNRLIMDLATSLSAADGSDLQIVHAWHLHAESMLRQSALTKISTREINQLAREERKRKKAALDRLLDNYLFIDRRRQTHLIKGEAREIIPDLARRDRVEFVVMGTVTRTDVQGLFIGNTAEAILNQLECSVLAVKPPGFESPVRLDGAEERAPALEMS